MTADLHDERLARWTRAGLVTGVVDFLFATALSVFAYGSTFSRLWQGVASVPLGRRALEGGAPMVAAGVLLHFCVAFAWSAVFVFLVLRSPWVLGLLRSWPGVIAVACLYGPLIWTAMSFLVIPAFTQRPPTVNFRWWVQFFAHIPFVAVPIARASRR